MTPGQVSEYVALSVVQPGELAVEVHVSVAVPVVVAVLEHVAATVVDVLAFDSVAGTPVTVKVEPAETPEVVQFTCCVTPLLAPVKLTVVTLTAAPPLFRLTVPLPGVALIVPQVWPAPQTTLKVRLTLLPPAGLCSTTVTVNGSAVRATGQVQRTSPASAWVATKSSGAATTAPPSLRKLQVIEGVGLNGGPV